MLAFRLIARLDIRNADLIKTRQLEGVRKVGDPFEYATRYAAEGLDELLYIDAVASLYGRSSLADLLGAATDGSFVPVTACGGVRSVDDGLVLLRAGGDKVGVNSAALKRPSLITELAEKFGNQSVVVQIDAKRKKDRVWGEPITWQAFVDGGREPTGRDALDWAVEAERLGAGELLVTSVDREGTGAGLDLPLLTAVAGAVRIPVVGSGGVATTDHIVAGAQSGVSGIAIAGAFHYDKVSPHEAREALRAEGIPVRS